MKSYLVPTLLIVSLGSIGVLGFFGMGAMNHSEQHSCPVSVLSGENCPPSGDMAALASHHLSGLQDLTLSTPSFSFTAFFVSILLLILLFAFSLKSHRRDLSDKQNVAAQYSFLEEREYQPKQRFLHWLELLYKRDPHALSWVHDYA